MAWSLNKVVFVCDVYVLDPSCANPTRVTLGVISNKDSDLLDQRLLTGICALL